MHLPSLVKHAPQLSALTKFRDTHKGALKFSAYTREGAFLSKQLVGKSAQRVLKQGIKFGFILC